MTSRLSQIQARFQQRQMQEKEEKLLRLYENQQQRAMERVNRGSAGSDASITSVTTITTQGGKVRQMFDERRHKAGIDRSYPLEPLKPPKTNTYPKGKNSLDRLRNDKNNSNKTVAKATVQRSVTHVINGKPLINKREIVRNIYNNNDGDDSYEEHTYEDENDNALFLNRTYKQRNLEMMMNDHHINDNIDDEEFPDVDIDEFDEPLGKLKLSNIGGKLLSENGPTKEIVEQKVFMKNGSPIRKTPVLKNETKQTVKKTNARTTVTPQAGGATTNSPRSSKPSSASSSPRKVVSEVMNVAQSSKSPNAKNANSASQRNSSVNRPSSKLSKGPSTVNRDDLDACKYCNRRFAADRLAVHQDICARTAKKKRKTYDATKHRVEGTELEQYTRKSNRTATLKSKQLQVKKTDWRRKHEEFISTIRAAKTAQAHVAKGGKLSDLPPPPPSSNPDYVQCPHCGRRFNETAAQRHIPKCASYEYNKPKQTQRPKR